MVVLVQVGMAPPAFAIVPKTTFWAGGVLAWVESVGTTWHSAHATGPMRKLEEVGFTWPRCAPVA